MYIHSGALLETAIEKQTTIGIQAKPYIERGVLVPDIMITTLVMQRLKDPEVVEKGYVLDGFPRTKAQANSLIQAGYIPDHVGMRFRCIELTSA